jgi:uncharacterized membrane protein YccC
MATYRTRSHHPLLERLVDNAIGASIGAAVAVLLWLGTLWLLFR